MNAAARPLRIVIVTDAWRPQVNGVVRTLTETKKQLELMGHAVELIAPERFTTFPCPTYPEIRLSLAGSGSVGKMLDAFAPDAVHIATEGPLGWAARKACLKRNLPFTTAYHTRFPEYVNARIGAPLSWSYAVLRRFHGPASRVMVPTPTVKKDLETWGFNNVVLWTRGVDPRDFQAGSARPVADQAADLRLCRARRGREERRSVPEARSTRIEMGGRRKAPRSRRSKRPIPA